MSFSPAAGYARRVTRHAALIPLSHDHHHGLVQARRLRRAASASTSERLRAAVTFLAFFASETRTHFRDEEEHLFPLLVGAEESVTALLTRALLEHQQLHALVAALEADVSTGDVSEEHMRELAEALEQHIRFEERTLFPLIETVASDNALRRLQEAAVERAVDLSAADGTGPLWGTATEDLNATLLAWPPGSGPAEHVNAERDVLLVVLSGSATVTVDGREEVVEAGHALVLEKRATRKITAGPDGVRYLSVHVRRPPLQLSPLSPRSGAT